MRHAILVLAFVLAGAPFAGYDELQWLAGYLWYAGNHNISGHHIVDGFGAVGDATNFFSLCYVTTVYGDWGLCDEITLWQSDSSILQSTGTVTPGTPAFLRMIQGNCN